MDCNKTSAFLREWDKMCRDSVDCENCPLGIATEKMFGSECDMRCRIFVMNHPEKAINIMQEWLEAHQPSTRFSVLKKQYPKLQLDEEGLPLEICAGVLYGFDCYDGMNCVDCWNTPVEGVQ